MLFDYFCKKTNQIPYFQSIIRTIIVLLDFSNESTFELFASL